MKKVISKTKHFVLSAALLLTVFSASSFTSDAALECCAATSSNGEETTIAVRCAETQAQACLKALEAVQAKQ